MSFAREGLALIGVMLVATALAYGIALQRRSWSIWLVAFGLTLLSLVLAWLARDPVPVTSMLAGVTSFAERPGA